jgi:hypothetical protein|tara:strand:- start:2879 stop:3253 length:375 start_codon:yes stop_codon:yes gene_type:complete
MKHKKIFFLIILFLCSFSSFSQVGKIHLNQDPKLTELMKLKKEVNQEDFTSGQFTIQVYNGTYENGAELMKKLISEGKFKDVVFSFETPYYKIRIGKYVSKIEVIKELKSIKKTFPSAFILKPN